MVTLPVATPRHGFLNQGAFSDSSVIANPAAWKAEGKIAAAGSLEILLSPEAADRLDPYKRFSSLSRELRAPGHRIVVSDLVGAGDQSLLAGPPSQSPQNTVDRLFWRRQFSLPE